MQATDVPSPPPNPDASPLGDHALPTRRRIPWTGRLSPAQRQTLARLVALAVVIVVSVLIYSIRDQAQELARYGYPGIFLLSILANATVFLPAPGILIVIAMGAVFNPLWVALAAGSGAAIGELSGYLAGFSGRAVVERVDIFDKLMAWMQDHRRLSYALITLLAFVPNPLFDLAGIAAGSLRIRLGHFLFFCWVGKVLKMLALAYLGATSAHWLLAH